MDTYNPEIVKRLSINPVAEQNLLRVATALNGLTRDFGKTWVEANLFGFDPEATSRELNISVDVLIHERADFDDLVFLWEDLEDLRNLSGFDQLHRKLKQGRRAQNVDLEIAVAAGICRLKNEVELEPSVGNGRLTDLRFRSCPGRHWTYVEITRKTVSFPGKLLQERGERLAALVAARDPKKRNFIATTRQMDPNFSDVEFEELAAWIPNSDPHGRFKDFAFVGSVIHGEDETPIALRNFPGPVSVIQHGNIETGAFGVAYLRVPDLGAADKIKDKSSQAIQGAESLLFIDLTSTHATQAEWDDQIGDMQVARDFSAVILMRDQRGANGFTRVCKVVEPTTSNIPLSDQIRSILQKFSELKVQKTLS